LQEFRIIFITFFSRKQLMKKILPFMGCATALVTPFYNGEIDKTSLRLLIERQIEAGIRALVIGGTTGECATLTDKEREMLYREAIKITDGRAKVILGTGTNDTRVAISHTRLASDLGADAILTVTPYYNKGTTDGILRHYESIAQATSLPLILYNVPSRTGVNLSFEVLERLAQIDKEMELAGSDYVKTAALYEEQDALHAKLDELYELWDKASEELSEDL
jgi:dihydrodipicolinate synthase/N-acetylneuraminate lyase